jgi:LysR family transcriptional activator of nhaA
MDVRIIQTAMPNPTAHRAARSQESAEDAHSEAELRAILTLNVHHLGYFGAVVQCGGVHAAARVLHVGAATISAQLKELEAAMGRQLLVRQGQRLVPTRFGEQVYQHVQAWFAVGQRLLQCLERTPDAGPQPLYAGIADGIPLMVASRLLSTAVASDASVFVL